MMYTDNVGRYQFYFRVYAGLVFFAAAILSGCSTPIVKSKIHPVDLATAKGLDDSWVAIIGEDRLFSFNGEYIDSKPNSGYQMLYPAPNFAGFLAGVATHAAIQNAQNSAYIEAQRTASDRILEPFHKVIDKMLVHSVFESALRMRESDAVITIESSRSDMTQLEVDLAAHGIMAQSRRALIVDLVAKVRNSSTKDDAPEYLHKVRVISNPIEADDAALNDYWLADNGRRLEQIVSQLLARAIDLFISDANQQLVPPRDKQITARYLFGNERRTERVVVLEKKCTRATMRTLRGWILSAPVPGNRERQTDCADSEVASHLDTPPA